MSPNPPSSSTFFAGGSPKVPRFGSSSSSKRRPFTPDSTRDDLALKRATETARQQSSISKNPLTISLSTSSGLDTAAEDHRTSFSDDMGRALDSIGMAKTPPPPPMPATSFKERVPAEESNGTAAEDPLTPGAATLAPPKDTERLAPANSSTAVRQTSNPVKDVKTADFEGVPVFFLDSAMESGILEHHVVSITASPDKRTQPLVYSPGSIQGSSAVPQTTSSVRFSQLPISQPRTPESAPEVAKSQPDCQSAAVGTDPQELTSPLGLEENAPQQSSQSGIVHGSADRLADRVQRRTFGQSSDDRTWTSSDTAQSAPDAPRADGTPQTASTGVADKALYAASAAGVGGVVAAAATVSRKEDELDISHGVPAQSNTTEGHTPAGERSVENAQSLNSTPSQNPVPNAQGPETGTDASPVTRSDGQEDALTVPETETAAKPDDTSAVPTTVTSAAVGAATGAAVGAALPDSVGAPPEGRPCTMSSVSAVPDDLDKDCLPELNAEGIAPPLSTPNRDLAASPASVPDGYDTCTQPAQPQHKSSMGSVPVVYSPGTEPNSQVPVPPAVPSPGTEPKTLESVPVVYSPGAVPKNLSSAPVVYSPGTSPSEQEDSTRNNVDPTPALENQEFSRTATEKEELQPAFFEGSEGASKLGMAGVAGAGALGAGAIAAGAALGGTMGMPEERSMSAASVVAIKDGRTGVPGAVRTSNLVCEPAPKTGETFMTTLSATPSEFSLGGETRRGNEAALSTASIIAIRGGNEGAPPSPPGRSPLAASRTANEMLDQAEREEGDRLDLHPYPLAGAGVGVGEAGLAAVGRARDAPEEDANAAEDLCASKSTSALGAGAEIRSPTPREDGDLHTSATSTPAGDSFVTGREGTTTPLAPGDYMGAKRAATPQAPGAFPVDLSEQAQDVSGAERVEDQPAHEEETAVATSEAEPTTAAEPSESAAGAVAEASPSLAGTTVAAGAATGVVATGAASAVGVASPSKVGTSTTTPAKANGNRQIRISTERKPVSAEISNGPSRPTPSKPTPGAEHSRIGSKSSGGDGSRVGFLSKLKDVLSGKRKKDHMRR
ncbi:hypothetical protein CspeluHIS016_0501990 [Cutaneotrichosporon spelunceum]|uniref:Uncharacterized protein n=1 Tax=Cutaneotrichosporon spelunceum TaxID=1672016 RepID=A0AAD3TXC9_9TREE|nr:hypothetical protein CspeluHIS016_0501990 [Cutaneotrichosporon spelunceum]